MMDYPDYEVSFRARPVDFNKPLLVYQNEDILDFSRFRNVSRRVIHMPTGVEKEEETETHLQEALTEQQFSGTTERCIIPVPSVEPVGDRYEKLYLPDYVLSRQYICVEDSVRAALRMDQEIPDYDLDSEDEAWLDGQKEEMEISPIKFERMIDRLEKASGQKVVSFSESKRLLEEDDELVINVYRYWLNKRLRLSTPLIAEIKPQKHDGSTDNHPYVAFRRRSDKIKTRKKRRNDVFYEMMLEMKRDFKRVWNIAIHLKRREKNKKELIKLILEIVQKRYQMKDYSGALLAEAKAEQAKMPMFVPPFMLNCHGVPVPTVNGVSGCQSVLCDCVLCVYM